MSSNQNLQRIGSLDALVYENGEGPYTLILFHGFGADAADLYPLVQLLAQDEIGTFYFPNGIQNAGGVPMGRAWFPIDVQALEKAMQTGEYRDFREMPKGLSQARTAAESFIETLDLDPKYTILGGFSQGAMLATHLTLTAKEPYAGLAILSGTYLGQNEWSEMAIKNPIEFFKSHGEQAPILPYFAAAKLNKMLKSSGWKGEFVRFSGGHEIPMPVLVGLKAYLNKVVSK